MPMTGRRKKADAATSDRDGADARNGSGGGTRTPDTRIM